MSRLLLLSILMLWMCPRDASSGTPSAFGLGLFIGVYAGLVGMLSLWSRMLARRVGDDLLGRSLDRYNKATEIARYFVPVWFAVRLFALGWGQAALDVVSRIEPWRRAFPARVGGAVPETYW